MVSVVVNGEQRSFEDGTTVEGMLTALEIRRSRLAVERNREIVPRTAYAQTPLAEGDRFEIVSLVGGG